jgi:hypothetical protein
LARVLVTLLGDSEKRRCMGELAFQIVNAHDHAFNRNFLLAERFL